MSLSRCLACLFALAGAAAPAAAVDPAAVDRAIERGIKSLLDATIDQDVITFRTRQRGGTVRTVRGHVVKDHGARIDFRTVDGENLSIRKVLIEVWKESGYLKDEMDGFARSGPTTLAAFALVAAGVDTNTPQLARMLGALERADPKGMGTYVRSLRACLWGLLLDRRLDEKRHATYRRLLQQDVNWLLSSRTTRGAHTYDHPRSLDLPGDNSNTQFAHLGLWAGAAAGAEISSSIWLNMESYWLGGQEPDGGWPYVHGTGGTTSSMTVAGCNSLYIVLDRHYARADFAYRFFEGARPNKKARDRMDRIYRAIDDGNAFLTVNRPSVTQHQGYELFGLERLGLASGRTHIGGVDWFEHYAGEVAGYAWRTSPIGDAFTLIFLVHGRAPVLLQKLAHGQDVHEWNYYHRDLSGLVRYLSGNFERMHRWQIIPETATLESMQSSPFLYISGSKPLVLPEGTRATIRRYVDGGGVVFLHADRASGDFASSTERLFEDLFADRGLSFVALDGDHPLYTCLFRGGKNGWKKRVPFKAILDGPRILVLLCPVDLAGAWHQDRREHRELYEIMANFRVYAAPPYAELPLVLRARPAPAPVAPRRGSLSLLRLAMDGAPPIHREVWQRHADDILRRTGLELRVDEAPLPADERRLAGYDVVHVSTRGAPLSAAARAALTAYARNGGFLLIDAADGQAEAVAAVRDMAAAIDAGQRDLLAAGHPLALGAFDGGQSLIDLDTTRAGMSLRSGKGPPPIVLRVVNGRIAVAACPFDLVAGLNGHHVWQRIGYTPDATRKIADNLLLWRWKSLNPPRGTGASP